ncbi:signal transduction histidine kinase [Serpentinimonas raichei]|uniref:histidine kinase n=1 Tax=Serpentinimonas raichei TaxID=1458425 RepID=A0A060NMP8_9BURK|nr:sensor histidine kinase [Serpentinimonas raichei]BAO80788.1 signal transduction histidine kinase [Serpentinimonas raichei]
MSAPASSTAPAAAKPPLKGHRLRLSRQLLLWLLLPQIVLWAAGGAAAYRLAASYVDQALDMGLAQSSRALARQLKPLGDGLLIDFPRAAQAILEADPQDRQFYMVSSPPGSFILGNHTLPPPPPEVQANPQPDQPFFYDGLMPSMPGSDTLVQVRVVALYQLLDAEFGAARQQVLIQVARSKTTRQQLVERILVDMLLPLSTLMVLMSLIVWFGIQAGLAPIRRLTQQVEGRAASKLDPIELDGAPLELHALAQALNTLLADARQHLEQQRRYIGDAAHQLRTPLAGLKAQTELALQQLETSERAELRQRLAKVHESAARSAHLVNQLLSLARSEPGAPLPQMQRTDLLALLQTVVAEWVPKALRAQIDLGWEHRDGAAAWVWAEPTLLREVLSNLIDNAILYAGRGAEITVGLDSASEPLQIWVRDNGPGIAPELRERAFERFFRGTQQGNGCGLGLAIVRDIVQRHGGEVALRHPSEGGLEVRISLPAMEAPAPAPAPALSTD